MSGRKKNADRYASIALDQLKERAFKIAQSFVEECCSNSKRSECLCRESLPRLFFRTIEKISVESLDQHAGDILSDYLSQVYEYLLLFTVKRKEAGACRIEPFSKSKKRLGNFYTPKDLALFAVEKALNQLVHPHGGRQTTSKQILNLKIVDPAMGTGIFLNAALDYLSLKLFESQKAEALNRGECEQSLWAEVLVNGEDCFKNDRDLSAAPSLVACRREIACNCLYGVDLDEGAVEVARLLIALRCANTSPAFSSVLAEKLKCGNALIGCLPNSRFQGQSFEDSDLECNNFFGFNAAEENSLRYFHWRLQFPGVFDTETPGFDAVLGNPPWEIHKPNSREFFQLKHEEYWTLSKQEALRKQDELRLDAATDEEWLGYKNDYKLLAEWITKGGAFSLQGSSDINAYKLFVELSLLIVKKGGVVSLVVPSSLYSDKGSLDLRAALLADNDWLYLHAFHNAEGYFDIHRSFKFCIIVFQKNGATTNLQATFDASNLVDVDNANPTVYSLDKLRSLSPGWLSVPEIQDSRDFQVLEKIGKNSIRLGRFVEDFDLKFKREFDMTNDSEKFMLRDDAEADGFRADECGRWLRGNWTFISDVADQQGANVREFVRSADGASTIYVEEITDTALPLYEGRMIGHFDVAQKGWIQGKGRQALWLPVPDGRIMPQYLLNTNHLKYEHDGLKIGFLGVGSATNARSMIAACLGNYPCGNSVATFSCADPKIVLLFAACLNSFVFDYLLRLRLVGNNLNYFILQECYLPCPEQLINAPGVVEISAQLCVNEKHFAPMLQHVLSGKDIVANVHGTERLRLRCILDALIADLYGLDVEDLSFILRQCDNELPVSQKRKGQESKLSPKGFWRVDKTKPPAARQTVLTLGAFKNLKELGRTRFLSQNDQSGWQLPSAVIGPNRIGTAANSSYNHPLFYRYR
jgi:hypothetical protein